MDKASPSSVAMDTQDKAGELAALVATLNRFLLRFAALDVFQGAGLGLTEWAALSLIAERPGINNRQLANLLGVSPQRVNQITDSLKGSGLIAVTASAEDGRVRAISITVQGTGRLNDLNSKLQPNIGEATQKRPALLPRINKVVNTMLMRIVTPPNAGRVRGRRRRQGRAVS